MQPLHAEDDSLHNSDVAMQQAKLARYQVKKYCISNQENIENWWSKK